MESTAIVNLKRADNQGDASARLQLSDLVSVSINGRGEDVAALMNLVLPYVLKKHLAREQEAGRSVGEVKFELQQVFDKACDEAGLPRLFVSEER